MFVLTDKLPKPEVQVTPSTSDVDRSQSPNTAFTVETSVVAREQQPTGNITTIILPVCILCSICQYLPQNWSFLAINTINTSYF